MRMEEKENSQKAIKLAKEQVDNHVILMVMNKPSAALIKLSTSIR